jgi:hypothetical protein
VCEAHLVFVPPATNHDCADCRQVHDLNKNEYNVFDHESVNKKQ